MLIRSILLLVVSACVAFGDERHPYEAFPMHRLHESDGISKFFEAHAFRRKRVFAAQAETEIDCSVVPDPCGQHGKCITGSGCVCDQEVQTGFWAGTTCGECDVGWAGSDCKTECLGGSCNECSGHGTCRSGTSGDGSCECYDDNSNGHWGGQDCSVCARGFFGDECLQSCPGSDSALGSCYGRGLCKENELGEAFCECDIGWDSSTGCATCDAGHYGPSCKNQCDGYNATTELPCSGHGRCFNGTEGSGKCECFVGSGYGDFDCSRQCPGEPPCSEPNGQCNEGADEYATCTCKPNFALPDCRVCVANRTGDECELDCPLSVNDEDKREVCGGNGICQYNKTDLRVTCACAPGYHGSTCEAVCPGPYPPCSGHGTCVSGVCQCFADEAHGYWDGVNCDRCLLSHNQSLGCGKRCPTSGSGTVCNGHGECVEGRCYCVRRAVEDRLDYCGAACEIGTAPGATNAEGLKIGCSVYYCAADFMLGAGCSIECAGREIREDGVHVCNDRGWCSQGVDERDPRCVCEPSFAGDACELTCPAVGGLVCGGPARGHCTSTVDEFGSTVAVCNCYHSFDGPACEYDCPVVAGVPCSGNGVCANTSCICNPGWTGTACNVPCTCDALNGECDHIACANKASYEPCGICVCRGNFTGLCDRCIAGTQGQQCEGECVNGVTVGTVCECDDLWSTASCSKPCPRNETGVICSGHGDCNDGAKANGDCECHPPGNPAYFGEMCDNWCVAEEKCTVAPYNLLHPQCNPLSGDCECQRSQAGYWDGEFCDECLIGFWGADCADECQCNDHGRCDKDTGACICFSDPVNGYYTGQSCEECAPGYIGERCERQNVLITRLNLKTNETAGYLSPPDDALGIDWRTTPAPTAILVDERLRYLYAGSMPITKFALHSGYPRRFIESYEAEEIRVDVDQNVTQLCEGEAFGSWLHQDSIYHLMQPSVHCGTDVRILRADRKAEQNLNFSAMEVAWTWSVRNKTVRIRAAEGLGNRALRNESLTDVQPVIVLALVQYTDPGQLGEQLPGGFLVRVDLDTTCIEEIRERQYTFAANLFPTTIALQVPPVGQKVGCGQEAETIAVGGHTSEEFDILLFKKELAPGSNRLAPYLLSASVTDYSIKSHVQCWPATGDARGDTGSSASTVPSETCAGCRSVDKLRFFNGSLVAAMHVLDDAKRPHSFVLWVQPSRLLSPNQVVLARLAGTTRCTEAYYDRFTEELVDVNDPSRRDPSKPTYFTMLARIDAPGAFATALAVDEEAGITFASYQFQAGTSPGFIEKFYINSTKGTITVHGLRSLTVVSVGGVSTPEVFANFGIDYHGRVLYALFTGTKRLRIAAFLLTEIHSLTPALADQRGGSVIEVRGLGFKKVVDPATGRELFPILCSFGGLQPTSQPVTATNVTFYSLQCVITPVDNSSSAVESCDGQPVDISNFGMQQVEYGGGGSRGLFTDSGVAVKRVQSARLDRVDPVRGGTDGGTVVTLHGQGFTESASANCKFFSTNPLSTETLYAPLTFVDPNTAECVQPAATQPSLVPSFVDVALDGQLYTEGGPLKYDIVGVAANLSSPAVYPVIGRPVTPLGIEVSIVDDRSHDLGNLDTENRVIVLNQEIEEIDCDDSLFTWRNENDTYPYPPCRPLVLSLVTNTSTFSQVSRDGVARFDNLVIYEPRATSANVTFTYASATGVVWRTKTVLLIMEGEAVALAISNVKELEGKMVPRGVSLSPAPEIIAVDELGNILQNPGVSITVSAQTFYVMDENHDEVTLTNRYVQLHRSEGNKVSFASVVFQFVHGAAHYINFTSDNPRLRPVTSPEIRTTKCENPSLWYKLPNSSDCAPCPPIGARCDGTEVIVVLPGYWRGSTSSFIYKCPGGPDVCPGTANEPNHTMRGAPCQEGYEGPLCSNCKPSYGRSGPAGCAKCGDETVSFLIVIAGVVGVLGGLLAWSTSTLRTAEFRDHQVIFRTIVNHVQAAGKLGQFSNEWSPFLKAMFDVQETSSSMNFSGVASLDCLLRAHGHDYSTVFAGYMCLPLVALVMAFGVFFVVRVAKMKPVISKELEEEIQQDIRAIGNPRTAILLHRYPLYMVVVTTLCVTMFTLYQTLITQATTVLVCTSYVTEEGSEEHFLDVDRTIPCDEKGNHKFRSAALLFSAGYGIGIPLAFVFGYMFVNGRIGKPALTFQMFMFLIAGYKDQYWWWQAIIMVRKMVLVFVIVFVRSNPHLQSYCGMWSMTAALVAQIWFQPNSKPEFNLVESVSLAAITITLNLGLLYFWPELDDFGRGILTALLILISIGVVLMLCFFLYAPLKEFAMEKITAVLEEIEQRRNGDGDDEDDDDEDKGPRRLELRDMNANVHDGDDFSDDSDMHRLGDDDAPPRAASRARSSSRAGVLRLPQATRGPAPTHGKFEFDLDDDDDRLVFEEHRSGLRQSTSSRGPADSTAGSQRLRPRDGFDDLL